IMKDVVSFAGRGGIVIGICNGFQILCESGLLPGALLRNASLSFVCKDVDIRVERTSTVFTSGCTQGEILRIPIAHGEGNFHADKETLDHIEENDQVLFRYTEPDGTMTERSN